VCNNAGGNQKEKRKYKLKNNQCGDLLNPRPHHYGSLNVGDLPHFVKCFFLKTGKKY
jgi:hypothetical protein